VALDLEDQGCKSPAPRWLPDPIPATLGLFDRVFAVSAPAARRLRRMGIAAERLVSLGPLSDAGPPLECPDHLHEEIAETLTGRPVWLAAHLSADEAADVLRAHRQALRLAHRLVLIIAPASAKDGKIIAGMISGSGLRCLDWDSGDLPEEITQVILAKDGSELAPSRRRRWGRRCFMGPMSGSIWGLTHGWSMRVLRASCAMPIRWGRRCST
jgi:3-deoxy-D-manno-octulosonic-acid transferase